VRLVARGSYCETDPLDARLYVYVTFRNVGGADGSVDARPWRRYNDGTVNESAIDEFTVDVPAHETKRVYGKYDYNALDHELIECGVYLGHNATPTPLDVR
jgi:hypothetical protein